MRNAPATMQARNRRDWLRAGVALLAARAVPLAHAEAYPSRPIHCIVPFPPGGTTDFVARLIGKEVGTGLGQPWIVDNKPGAGTVLGVELAARAPADGYTLVSVANSFAVNRTLVRKLPYDSEKDLRPVAMLGLSEHVLASYPPLGIRSVADLLAYAKKNPGKLSFASFGNGTSAQLAGEMLRLQLGIDMIHVPYKGQGPALADLLAGQVSLMFGNWPEFRSQIEAGKLTAVGMATAQRSVYAPQIPTLTEQGAPIESNSWSGLLAPAGVSDAVVARLNAEVQKALASAPVSEAFRAGGIAAMPGTPQQFARFLNSEYAKYAKLIRDAHITLEG